MNDKKPYRIGTVYISDEAWRELQVMARRRDLTRTAFMRNILMSAIANEPKVDEEDESKAWNILDKRRDK